LVFAFVIAAEGVWAQPAYTVTMLPTDGLPDVSAMTPTLINNRGVVAGYWITAANAGAIRGFLWSSSDAICRSGPGTCVQDLGPGFPTALSDTEFPVVTMFADSTPCYIWHRGVAVPVPYGACALGVNPNGNLIVGHDGRNAFGTGVGHFAAWTWPELRQVTYSSYIGQLMSVNDAGIAAGWLTNQCCVPVAFNVVTGSVLSANLLSGSAGQGSNSQTGPGSRMAINAVGQVIGETEEPFGGFFYYDPVINLALAAPTPGRLGGLNNKGQLVGTSVAAVTGESQAYIYDFSSAGGGAVYDLNALLLNGSPTIRLHTAAGINDSGWIIAHGVNFSGTGLSAPAFLLQPMDGDSADTSAPSTPTGLLATAISTSQIDLSWIPSTDDVAVAGYNIFRDGTQINTSIAPSFSDTGLSPSTTYTYAVSAYDADGNSSEVSPAVAATTVAVFDFALSNGGNKSVVRAGSVANTITATLSSGMAAAVFFTTSGLPAGANISYSQASCAPACSTNVTITTTAATPLATFTLVITGTAGSLVRTTTFNLTVTSASDPSPPTVALTAPANNSTVRATITLSATASDNISVKGVQFLLDGANLNAEDTKSPYSISWNTAAVSGGPHALSARARDAAGNTTTATIVNVIVDNQAPTGSILINAGAPATNNRTSTLTLAATDNPGLASQMRFSNTGTGFTAAEPFATTKTWTLSTGAGNKTVYVQFSDAAGNWSASFSDSIILDTTAPAIAAVATGHLTNSSATITWSTDEAATSQIEYGVTSSYGLLTIAGSNLVTSHNLALTGLAPQTTYNYRVRSKDAAGNERIGSNNLVTTLAGSGTPPRVGTSFLAATLADSNLVPPSPMGAVGPGQILMVVNGRVRTFTRSGVADGALNMSSDVFFNSVRNAARTGDPSVIYDRLAQRWFVTMITVGVTPNRILIAVSNGPTITNLSSFTFFQFRQDSVGGGGLDNGQFADYASTGVDKHALYVGVNIFTADLSTYARSTVFVVNKTNLLAGNLTVTAFRGIAFPGFDGPFAPHGVTNMDPDSTEGYFIGTSVNRFGELRILRVTDPGGVPSITPLNLVTPLSTRFPVNVPARGSVAPLDRIDDRLSNATIVINPDGTRSLWTAHAIGVTQAGVALNAKDRSAMRFYEITDLTGTPAVAQSGTLYDSASSNFKHFWVGSIATSGQRHTILASSYAGTADYAGIAIAGRFAGDTVGTLSPALNLLPGVAAYNVTGGSAPQRWGDYTNVVVDPTDNMTMWAFQEYTNATNSWGVRIIEVKAPPPAVPSDVLPATVSMGTSTSVTITGTSANGSGFYDPGAGFTKRLSASISGSGVTVNSVIYTDPTNITLNLTIAADAAPGGRTIIVTNPDGQFVTSAANFLTIGMGAQITVSSSLPSRH
jgi:chitodextrinase